MKNITAGKAEDSEMIFESYCKFTALRADKKM